MNADNVLSPALAILVKWGEWHLMGGGPDRITEEIGRLLRGLEADFAALAEGETSPLNSDLECFEGLVKESLAWLGGADTLGLLEQDLPAVQEKIASLDSLVFLSQAGAFFPGREKAPEGFWDKVNRLLETATVDQTPSTIRLIPLNSWRREIRDSIPSRYHFLFPWYDQWTDLPADTLDMIAEHWDEVCRGEPRGIGIEEIEAAVLLTELQGDTELVKHLGQVARAEEALLQFIADSPGLHLFLLGIDTRERFPLPATVVRAGPMDCALKALQGYSELEHRFIEGFCGVEADDRKQLACLVEIERSLPKIPPAEVSQGSLTEQLLMWFRREVGDRKFSDRVFERWIGEMRVAAREILLDRVLSRLKNVPEKAEVFIERLWEITAPQPILEAVLSRAAGAEGTGEGKEEDWIGPLPNPLLVPTAWNEPTESYPILGAAPGAPEDYDHLRDYLQNRIFYWFTVMIGRDGKIIEVSDRINKAITLPVRLLKDKRAAAVLVAISGKKKSLEGILPRVGAYLGETVGPVPTRQQAEDVIWVFHFLE